MPAEIKQNLTELIKISETLFAGENLASHRTGIMAIVRIIFSLFAFFARGP